MQTVTKTYSETFLYPAELIWKVMNGSSDAPVRELSQEEFDTLEPGGGTVFTRVTQREENRLYAYRVKTLGFYADWRITLEPRGACETLVSVTETVDYRRRLIYVLSGFGAMVEREVRAFAQMLQKRVSESRDD